MDKKSNNIYKDLENQIRKISKHNRQGSFKTKERYFEANKRFCKFLAEKFAVRKFANISDKHITAYIEYMKEKSLSASTIKTDLGAIRFFHDKCENGKYTISGNSQFNLDKRKFGGVERSWTIQEYKAFKAVCSKYGQDRISAIATLARNEGLRIHETFKISRSSAESASNSGFLHVIGKGGKERDIPLTVESIELLKMTIADIERGQKLFIKDGEKAHLVIKQVQNFIVRHRDQWQEEGRAIDRTFHGLRHTYAQEQYQARIEKGLTDYQARLEVSRLLGHERDEVTRIYLARGN